MSLRKARLNKRASDQFAENRLLIALSSKVSSTNTNSRKDFFAGYAEFTSGDLVAFSECSVCITDSERCLPEY